MQQIIRVLDVTGTVPVGGGVAFRVVTVLALAFGRNAIGPAGGGLRLGAKLELPICRGPHTTAHCQWRQSPTHWATPANVTVTVSHWHRFAGSCDMHRAMQAEKLSVHALAAACSGPADMAQAFLAGRVEGHWAPGTECRG